MKEKLKSLFYRVAYLDFTDKYQKEETYFYRFAREIANSNLRMMRSMSIFMLIISLFVIASTFTYFAEVSLRKIYINIIILEIVLLLVIQRLIKHEYSPKASTLLTALHLFHMLAISGYIGVFFCKEETAIIFIVVLTISSMIFSLPTLLTMGIATFSTMVLVVASYYNKASYWFESDTLNCISVLIFSILFGWRVNRIRAEEAFSRESVVKLNEELKSISITDQLTGLNNHRKFQETYYEMFSRAVEKEVPLSIIMMDLDKFKAYNDNYGHVAGDKCLRAVAKAIIVSVSEGAIVCRYGGEEFIVLLDEKICQNVDIIGENIRKAIENLEIEHKYTDTDTGVVTVSIGGYVGLPTNDQQPMSFVDKADKAMYKSKIKGRNSVTIIKFDEDKAV